MRSPPPDTDQPSLPSFYLRPQSTSFYSLRPSDTMDDRPLASLSLTHVHYNPSDKVSYLCAWLALVPQGLCVAYATLIWSTREAEVLLMFAGQMACEGLNWCLKRYIKEERPRRTCPGKETRNAKKTLLEQTRTLS